MKYISVASLFLFLFLFATRSFAVIGPIVGVMASHCPGDTVFLSDTTAGGIWSSSSTVVATVSSSGKVVAMSPGFFTITYTVPGSGYVTSPHIMVNGIPTGGSYCVAGTGVDIYLNGSQVGVYYQLFHGAAAVGGMVGGTGSPISFGPQTHPGPYTAIGHNTAGCVGPMAGSATVTIDSVTSAISLHNVITTPDTVCSGDDFYLYVCGPSTSSFNVTTFYGDGTSDNHIVSPGS